MKAVAVALNQENVLKEAFSLILNFKLREGSFPALLSCDLRILADRLPEEPMGKRERASGRGYYIILIYKCARGVFRECHKTTLLLGIKILGE